MYAANHGSGRRGNPARSSTTDSFFRTEAGSSGASSFLGEGNIHREEILCRDRSRIVRMGAGRRMLRQEARVLGWETISFPQMRYSQGPGNDAMLHVTYPLQLDTPGRLQPGVSAILREPVLYKAVYSNWL